MKSIKKIANTFVTLLLTLAMIVTPFNKAFAATDVIHLGPAYQTGTYIAGVTFSYKVTTDGRYLYCLNIHKKTAQNTDARLIPNSSYINGGIVYILKNGYPYKSITGDKDKDYYITQTALWWYLDMTTGSQNLGDQFKQYGTDAYNMRSTVKALAEQGYAHRNDAIGITDTKLAIDAIGGKTMALSNGYYISNDIKATTAQNFNAYTVALESAPKGTIIVSSAGTETAYAGAFTVNKGDSFKVKVPASSVTGTTASIKVKATATGATQYMAYEYTPVDTTMQNIALLEVTNKDVSSEVNLEILSSRVSITKIDAQTKQAIAGAELKVTAADGTEYKWTSTINAHIIRNLPNGTYTLTEVKAPTGYILNTTPVKFTISDSNRDVKVTMENTPKKVVVNITKVDQATNTPLAGAILSVKDMNGNEIARFETTTESKILTDLANGSYYVEELSAPYGYIKSDERIYFTVDDSHLSHQITFKNAKEVDVPDTASEASLLMMILGLLITGSGICYIYKNGKRA